MASPQKENGYTSIANEILEALARLRISSYERGIVDVIIRKTYGFIDNRGIHKKWDRISYSQFSNATGINITHISRTLKKLEENNLILRDPEISRKTGKPYAVKYCFQKDYEKWNNRVYNPTSTNLGSTQNGLKVTPKLVQTKEKKETIQHKPSVHEEDSKLKHSVEAERLARLFLQLSGVSLTESKKEHVLKTWIDSIVKLHRIDEKEYSKIEKVIRWVTTETFWRTNCLSPVKFRRVDKDGTRYFDVFAYKMNPPKPEEAIRPSEVLV